MEVFLLLNGWELVGTIDEQERLMLDVAAGQISREQLTDWLEQHTKPIAGSSAVEHAK
jgi:death on curing protein